MKNSAKIGALAGMSGVNQWERRENGAQFVSPPLNTVDAVELSESLKQQGLHCEVYQRRDGSDAFRVAVNNQDLDNYMASQVKTDLTERLGNAPDTKRMEFGVLMAINTASAQVNPAFGSAMDWTEQKSGIFRQGNSQYKTPAMDVKPEDIQALNQTLMQQWQTNTPVLEMKPKNGGYSVSVNTQALLRVPAINAVAQQWVNHVHRPQQPTPSIGHYEVVPSAPAKNQYGHIQQQTSPHAVIPVQYSGLPADPPAQPIHYEQLPRDKHYAALPAEPQAQKQYAQLPPETQAPPSQNKATHSNIVSTAMQRGELPDLTHLNIQHGAVSATSPNRRPLPQTQQKNTANEKDPSALSFKEKMALAKANTPKGQGGQGQGGMGI